mgnify:CR=1 FL=1
MKNSIRLKLDNLKDRYSEVEALLSDAGTIANQNQFRDLSKEYSDLEEVVKKFNDFNKISLLTINCISITVLAKDS